MLIGEKLETFANDIMRQCQEQELTCWEVKLVMKYVSDVAEALRTDVMRDLKFKTIYGGETINTANGR